ncbi:hypothetical protein E2C01_093467 [Portunus trituberculatus]|uniref:Uncharacterized protein n=1 Tax=Portunus trituberculatus TaxID=210409 RepID=A0A5B7JU35_PORTR|nr:hypothetical protein [Portunus trituberculatus]
MKGLSSLRQRGACQGWEGWRREHVTSGEGGVRWNRRGVGKG